MKHVNDIDRFLSGEALYGDDFTATQIAEWFTEEERGYLTLAERGTGRPQDKGRYPYHAVNDRHGFRYLEGRRFGTCLGLGVAAGNDIIPLATQVEKFYCIEPAKEWWRPEIANKPATYVMPRADGLIDLPDGAIDLVVSLSVLHHIPNVTAVLSELCRVLNPNGYIIIREPITSMGDWRRPRKGLTKNERGLPLPWLSQTLEALRLRPISERLCFFPPLRKTLQHVGLGRTYKLPAMVALDEFLSTVMAFNVRYHRISRWEKFAPSVIFGVYQKY